MTDRLLQDLDRQLFDWFATRIDAARILSTRRIIAIHILAFISHASDWMIEGVLPMGCRNPTGFDIDRLNKVYAQSTAVPRDTIRK